MKLPVIDLAPLRRRADRVVIYGHRGARGVFPENTMAGFRYTAELGLLSVEFDVLVTAGLTPVLTHNAHLLADTTRGPDGTWLTGKGPRVADLTLDALQAYDVGAIRPGSPYHERFPEQARPRGAVIPTLADLCRLVADDPDFWLDIEIKSFPDAPGATAPPEDLAEAVIGVIREQGLTGRSILKSFDWRVLRACRDIAPGIPRAYLSELPPSPDATIFDGSPWTDGMAVGAGGLPRAVADLGGQMWCPFHGDLTPGDLGAAHELGLIVNVWTVNEADEIERFIEMGVDGIITDYPARAQNVLAARGMTWR